MKAYGVPRTCPCFDCRHDSKYYRIKWKSKARMQNKKIIQKEKEEYEQKRFDLQARKFN